MIEKIAAFAEIAYPMHRRAQRRAGAVGADQGLEGDLARAVVARIAEHRPPRIEVDRLEARIEMQARACGLGKVQQHDIEIAPVYGPDHLAVVAAVALQHRFGVADMDHAPAHHDRVVHHRVVGIGRAQRMPAALGQRQVDRAPAAVTLHAWIAAFLVQVDVPAALAQQDAEQGAGEAGADDRQVARRAGHASRHRATARTKRSTSAWLL